MLLIHTINQSNQSGIKSSFLLNQQMRSSLLRCLLRVHMLRVHVVCSAFIGQILLGVDSVHTLVLAVLAFLGTALFAEFLSSDDLFALLVLFFKG